jgi:hypothetical protein
MGDGSFSLTEFFGGVIPTFAILRARLLRDFTIEAHQNSLAQVNHLLLLMDEF